MQNKMNMNRKGRRRAAVLIGTLALAFVLAIPMVAFGASGKNVTREFHYKEGEPRPDVPKNLTIGGIEYELVSKSDPQREGDLPSTRTYVYQLDGSIPPEDLAEYRNKVGIVIREVKATYERETDDTTCTATIEGLATNDVSELRQKGYFEEAFTITNADTGTAEAELPLAELSYEPVDEDADGLPDSYTATMIYRGKESYKDLHYYEVSQTVTSTVTTPGSGEWVIVAVYAPIEIVATPPPAQDTTDTVTAPVTTPVTTPVTRTIIEDEDQDEPAVIPAPAETAPPETQTEIAPPADLEPAEIAESVEPESAGSLESPRFVIGDGAVVPLFGRTDAVSWALTNLILAIAGAVVAVIVGIVAIARRRRAESRYEDDLGIYGAYMAYELEDKHEQHIRTGWLIVSAVVAVVSVMVFLLTENWRNPVALLDGWTIVNAALLIIEIITLRLVFGRKSHEGRKEAVVYGK